MFRLYIECGSVGALAEELARRKIMSKVQRRASSRTRGGGPYSVGALAHFGRHRAELSDVHLAGEAGEGVEASRSPEVDRDLVLVHVDLEIALYRLPSHWPASYGKLPRPNKLAISSRQASSRPPSMVAYRAHSGVARLFDAPVAWSRQQQMLGFVH
jgi:hypothetical protein